MTFNRHTIEQYEFRVKPIFGTFIIYYLQPDAFLMNNPPPNLYTGEKIVLDVLYYTILYTYIRGPMR